MAINKVVYGANTLIDLTGDTVTADTLKTGFTAHDKSGTAITGTLDLAEGSVYQDEDGCVVLNDDDGSGVAYIPLTVSSNGTYTASSSYCYNPVTVNVEDESFNQLLLRRFSGSNGAFEYTLDPTVASYAFAGCSNLLYVDMPNVFSIQSYAFAGCSRLVSISAPKLTSVNMWGFSGCSSLQTVDLPNLQSLGQRAFTDCKKLQSVNLPKLRSVDAGTFTVCASLTDISIPVCTSIGLSAFGWTGLSSIYAPKVTYINADAFRNCSKLTTIDFPICSYVGYSAFMECYSLQSVSLPLCEGIGGSAFFRCSALSYIDLPECKSMGYFAFASTTLETFIASKCLTISSNTLPSTIKYVNLNGIISLPAYMFNGQAVESVFISSCEEIGGSAFRECTALSQISLPSVITVGSYAFTSCSLLTSIELPLATNIYQGAFNSCVGISYISTPNCNHVGVGAFAGDINLTSVSFPQCSTFGQSAFRGCSKLESIYLFGESISSINTNVFANTPMSGPAYIGHYGSIYVKQSLVESFKTAIGWSYYSSRFVGLTDEQIAALDAS